MILDKTDSHLRKTLPKPYSARITGEPRTIITLTGYVVQGQLMSLLSSLGVVFMIVVLLFKNWKAGIVSIIPIGFAVLVSFGIMLLVALLINNIPKTRKYPEFWF